MMTGKEHFDYYKNERGFDPTISGLWQDNYVAMVDRVFALTGKRILDVGAACGAQTSAMRLAGFDAWAIEPEPYFVQVSPFENMRGRILVAPAQDVPFRAGLFDFINCHQVLEHIPAGECGQALSEIRRVSAPGGLFYASLQIAGRPHDPKDDMTHINYQTMHWWFALLEQVGWKVTLEFDAVLNQEPMQQQYHWDYFVAHRGPA